VKVEWDEAENLANQRKHGISFEEAEELFAADSDYLEIFDEAQSVCKLSTTPTGTEAYE
jgi:uncharacterized DUF497 family protein